MNGIPVSGSGPGGVVVIGSVHRDYYRYVTHHPRLGETVLARSVAVRLGGKGANQAVAAARHGAAVSFVGCVGDDTAGVQSRSDLNAEGIDCALLVTATSEETGSAFVVVDQHGENSIIVHSGANRALTEVLDLEMRVGAVISSLSPCVVLTQGELTIATIERVSALSAASGSRFVLNLAPFVPVAAAAVANADPLVVNEGEARGLVQHLTGLSQGRIDELTGELLALVLGERAISVVVTLGDRGAVAAANGRVWHQATDAVERVVDTTGAGDAFTGALVAALIAHESLEVAVERGTQAGSHAVRGQGTTSSYPARTGPLAAAANAGTGRAIPALATMAAKVRTPHGNQENQDA